MVYLAPTATATSTEGPRRWPPALLRLPLTLLCSRSSEEAERNLRNASEDEARPAGILIK